MINVIDNILVALFAIMGDGLAPFRAVDTYHMAFIAHYMIKTWKIRQARALPDLRNKNDIPSRVEANVDIETGNVHGSSDKGEGGEEGEDYEFSVLSEREQMRLMHHQEKFAKSHTFYKPHETSTHYAFSLKFLITIVVLLDLHSCFQIALGSCTWSINYHKRPFALTTVILCCSIVCNISGGVMIMIGDRRARKKDVVERMFREKLTALAIKKMEKKKKREQKRQAQAQLHEGSGSNRPSLDITRAMHKLAPTSSRPSFDRSRGPVSLDKTVARPSLDKMRIMHNNLTPSSSRPSFDLDDIRPATGSATPKHDRNDTNGNGPWI